MKNKIAILIPCLNEELTIRNVINNFKKKLPSCKIFVYDNNSDDNTFNAAKKSGAEVVTVKERGKGNVVKKMFSDACEADFYVMIDGDNTYDISKINKMIEIMSKDNLDMIVGCRNHKDSSAYRAGHVLGNLFFSKLVAFIFGNKVKDVFSGFRIFSKRFIKTFPLHSRGFEIEAELTIHALEQRLSIKEFDCLYIPRHEQSNSKLNTFKDGIKILKLILVLIKDERPLMFFLILAFLFIMLSLTIGIPIILEFYETKLVERLPSAVLSGFLMVLGFLSFFSGLILDVIKKMRHENKRLNYLMFKK